MSSGSRSKKGDGQLTEPESLAQAFEVSVARADDIADRLRRDADLVAQKAQLLSDQSRQQQTHEALQTEMADLEYSTVLLKFRILQQYRNQTA